MLRNTQGLFGVHFGDAGAEEGETPEASRRNHRHREKLYKPSRTKMNYPVTDKSMSFPCSARESRMELPEADAAP